MHLPLLPAPVNITPLFCTTIMIFDLSARYSKSRYVTGVAVSDDGKRIAIAAMDAKDGDFLTDLTFYQPGLDGEISRVELTGTFPVSVDYMEGGFALLTLSGIYWYDIDGNAVSSYEFSKVPFNYSVSDIYYIVIIPKNIVGSVNQIVIFSSDGKQLYEGMIEERITDIAVSDYGFAYVLTQGQAIMIDIENNTETSVPISMQAKKILPAGGREQSFSRIHRVLYFLILNPKTANRFLIA